MFIYFLFVISLINSIILYFNIFNITNFINFITLIFTNIYNNLSNKTIKYNENNDNNDNNNEKNIIVQKFIKNINIELTPILLLLQITNEYEQLIKLNELEKKYPHISYIYPLKPSDNINDIIDKYLIYCNNIYS
jgi:hypothetical protein